MNEKENKNKDKYTQEVALTTSAIWQDMLSYCKDKGYKLIELIYHEQAGKKNKDKGDGWVTYIDDKGKEIKKKIKDMK